VLAANGEQGGSGIAVPVHRDVGSAGRVVDRGAVIARASLHTVRSSRAPFSHRLPPN
jgi:hypothetical protein